MLVFSKVYVTSLNSMQVVWSIDSFYGVYSLSTYLHDNNFFVFQFDATNNIYNYKFLKTDVANTMVHMHSAILEQDDKSAQPTFHKTKFKLLYYSLFCFQIFSIYFQKSLFYQKQVFKFKFKK